MEEAGGAAGSAPGGAEELDLSLDDIIKRNRKGQAEGKARGSRSRPPPKNRSPPYSNGRPRFWSWAPRHLQGPNRFPGAFGKQPMSRKPFWAGAAGPRRRAGVGPKGRSPLNRPAVALQGTPAGSSLAGSAADLQQGPPPGRAKPLTMARWALPPRRPFRLNRRPAFLQRQPRVNFHRGQAASSAEGKPARMRRWQPQPSSGAVLTVSVGNPRASQTRPPGAQRPFPRGRSTAPKATRRQPRGVPLRFNLRAVANQTSLTLDERFSGLRLRPKWRFSAAARGTGRTVTLP